MAARKTKDRIIYAALDDITGGILHPFNIVGYHVYGSGQTSINVAAAPVNIVRFDARRSRVVFFPSGFETSVTGITNGSKLLASLIDRKIIRGVYQERLAPTSKVEFGRQAKASGFVPSSVIARSRPWIAWHGRLKTQLVSILQDKPVFRDESKLRETMDYFKTCMIYVRDKYEWDLDYMRHIMDESYKEFMVKDTMES